MDNVNYMYSNTYVQYEAANNIADSTTLYSSITNDQINELEKSTTDNTKKNNAIVTQLNNLLDAATALKKAITFVYSEGTTIGSTGVTIGVGLTSLLSGNLLMGVPVTAMGLNEVRKMIERFNTLVDPGELLAEAKTGVAMIKQLEEYQVNSLDAIQEQISLAMDQIEATQQQLELIKELATHGSNDAEMKKQEAYKLTEQALRSQQQALYTLRNGRRKIEVAVKALEEIANRMNLLISAKEAKATPETIDAFIKEIELVVSEINEVNKNLHDSALNCTNGLKDLQESSKHYASAMEKYNEAILITQQALKEVQLRLRATQLEDARKELEKAQEEADIAKERAKLNQKIAEHAEQNLSELKKQEDQKFGTTSMVLGAAIGTAAIPLTSPIFFAPIAVIGAAGVHYARRLGQFTSKYAQTNLNPALTLEGKNLSIGDMKVKYNQTSTGWGGYLRDAYLMARKINTVGSRTEGAIALYLGDESSHVYRFNKNSKSELGMLLPEDIKKLDSDLRALMEKGKLKPQQILDIIKSLTNVNSEYGTLALVKPDCLYLQDLINQCKRKIG